MPRRKRRDLVVQPATQAVTILDPYNPRGTSTLQLKKSVRGPSRIGLFLIIVFIGGFGAWGFLVPLAGGAIAPGIISPDGSRRTVQHLEGGIIRKLHVRDGDLVERGQPLLLLESVQPKANHDLLRKQHSTLVITQARLEAERQGKKEVEFPLETLKLTPELMIVMQSQRELFHVRRSSHEARNKVLQQRIGQLGEQIKGFEAQVKSAGRQIELIAEEVVGKRELASRGHLTKPDLLRMMRMEAELTGRKGQYEAAISEARQQIGEAQIQLVANDAERADQIATQLEKVRAEINQLEEKLLASKDVLNRTLITAPVSGTIVDLKFKTESGVIQPGAPILDIVPADEKLLIDARVSPMDIDVVHSGLKAQVQLSAFSSRSTPRIDGYIRSVSADRLVDQSTGQAYFLARVEVEREEVKKIGPDKKLMAGMPADVLIVTGERTMANYLLRPFLDAVWRTLRET